MWQAIQYVTGGFTLCAFIAAIIAWAYKTQIQEQRRRIESAPLETRAPLVSRTLAGYSLTTEAMSEEKQLETVRKEMRRMPVSS